jgi:hypothetical protein
MVRHAAWMLSSPSVTFRGSPGWPPMGTSQQAKHQQGKRYDPTVTRRGTNGE